MTSLCPCKSGLEFSKCCKPIIEREKTPLDALELMRSRYSAYATKSIEYLLDTSCEVINRAKERVDIKAFTDGAYFQHLEIVNSQEYIVEFKAYFIMDKKQQLLHEKSNFIYNSNGSLCYKDGKTELTTFTPKRNSICICGSRKKYKQCCSKLVF